MYDDLPVWFLICFGVAFISPLFCFSPLWAHKLVLRKYLRNRIVKNSFPRYYIIDVMVLFGFLSLVNGLIACVKSYEREQETSYFIFLFLVSNVFIIVLWIASLRFLEKEEILAVKMRVLFQVVLFPLINISVSGAIINSVMLLSLVITSFSPEETLRVLFSEPMFAIVCTDALMYFAIWLTRRIYIRYIYTEPSAATASLRGAAKE